MEITGKLTIRYEPEEIARILAKEVAKDLSQLNCGTGWSFNDPVVNFPVECVVNYQLKRDGD